jgi:hypothetical protein
MIEQASRGATNGTVDITLDMDERRVELPLEMCGVVRANMELVTRLAAEVEAAKSRLTQAQENNLRLIVALVRQDGKDMQNFLNVNLWEEPGTRKVYLQGLTNEQLEMIRRGA